ncbi:hypothetical protein CPAV1605_28 [seawater metagenome]|uniref:Uncharacterized protein n=1 Tax=seawater metagenome TaxID=1561972 RepID=A0A5E8CFQ3_9ZZZZ
MINKIQTFLAILITKQNIIYLLSFLFIISFIQFIFNQIKFYKYKKLAQENKELLQKEIAKFIDENYSSLDKKQKKELEYYTIIELVKKMNINNKNIKDKLESENKSRDFESVCKKINNKYLN